MYTHYWDRYLKLLHQYEKHRDQPDALRSIQREVEDLAYEIDGDIPNCDEQERLQLTSWTATCFKFAAGCASNLGAFDEAANLYRSAIAHVFDEETNVELTLSLFASKRWAEACIQLNTISDRLVIDRMAEAGAELLSWICSETVLACGVSERVLRLCVMAANLQSPVRIQLGGETATSTFGR